MNRRRHEPWWPRLRPSPHFLVTLWALVLALAMALLSGCAKASQPAQAASPTQGERDAYGAGLVSGSFNAYTYALMRRLHAAGVVPDDLPAVISGGCRNITVEQVIEYVYGNEPRPRTEAEVTIQVFQALDHACSSLREASS